jgi:hypothetical protein
MKTVKIVTFEWLEDSLLSSNPQKRRPLPADVGKYSWVVRSLEKKRKLKAQKKLQEKARANLQAEYELGLSEDLRKGVKEEASVETKGEKITASGMIIDISHLADVL